MNKKYRKVMRMKRKHHHTSWCRCPEVWVSFATTVKQVVHRDYGGDYQLFWDSIPAYTPQPRRSILQYHCEKIMDYPFPNTYHCHQCGQILYQEPQWRST